MMCPSLNNLSGRPEGKQYCAQHLYQRQNESSETWQLIFPILKKNGNSFTKVYESMVHAHVHSDFHKLFHFKWEIN